MLDGLAGQTHEPDAVIVVDNASEDHTREVLEAHRGCRLQRIHLDTNTGGAGGFRAGCEAAYEQGFDRIWLMDDDVVPAPDCLAVLMAAGRGVRDGGARGRPAAGSSRRRRPTST